MGTKVSWEVQREENYIVVDEEGEAQVKLPEEEKDRLRVMEVDGKMVYNHDQGKYDGAKLRSSYLKENTLVKLHGPNCITGIKIRCLQKNHKSVQD